MTRRRTSDRESVLFTVAAGVIALHAMVDAFFAPERGTQWSDHLLRGFATLAVLAAAVALVPRLAPGARAAVAAAMGVLALDGAGLAIADTRAVGAHGEDWTGFLLAPVGLGLCGLAAALLWRSRKPGRLRYVRRLAILLASALAIFWVVLPLAVAIVATHRPRAVVAPANFGRPYKQVTLRTSDGLELAAWYVPSRNGAAVISFPTRKGRLPQARMLARHGFGVLLLDARGYDGSDGDPNVFGWGAAKDIDTAVAWLRDQPDVQDDRIGGIGFSVGGEMMLEAAAGNPGVRAVISEGAGARSIREDLIRGPRGWLVVPRAAVQTTALALFSDTSPPPSLERLVRRIAPRPLYLISAGRSSAGEDLNRAYFLAASEPKTLWEIPEASHVGGFQARPREYEQRVIQFFESALLALTE